MRQAGSLDGVMVMKKLSHYKNAVIVSDFIL